MSVHILISIPPNYSASQVIRYMKSKSAINIARSYTGRRKNFTELHFWARGYYLTSIGADEESVREYIKNQEKEDQRIDKLMIFE